MLYMDFLLNMTKLKLIIYGFEFQLHKQNVDIYTRVLPGSTWWMGIFIMGYCNSMPSSEHLHGFHR